MGWEDADGRVSDGWPTILVAGMFGTQSRERDQDGLHLIIPYRNKTSLGLVFSPTARLDSP